MAVVASWILVHLMSLAAGAPRDSASDASSLVQISATVANITVPGASPEFFEAIGDIEFLLAHPAPLEQKYREPALDHRTMRLKHTTHAKKHPHGSKFAPYYHKKRGHYGPKPHVKDHVYDGEEGPGHHKALKKLHMYHDSMWMLGISVVLSLVTISIYCCCSVCDDKPDLIQKVNAAKAAKGLSEMPRRDASRRSLSPQEDISPVRSKSRQALDRGRGAARRSSPSRRPLSPSGSRDPTKAAPAVRRTMAYDKDASRMSRVQFTRERAFSWHVVTMLQNTWRPEQDFETMSTFAFIVNIVADLVPSGFLSIAYGMEGIGYIPTFILIVVIGFLGTTTMWACGRSCEITGEYDFASQWAVAIGPRTAFIPLAVVIIVSFGALLCYACYFGDLLAEVMPAFNFPVPRAVCLISVSLFPTLPLCFLKNLSALSYTSFLAALGMIYVAIIMMVRAFDGSYLEGGVYYDDVVLSHHPEGGNIFRVEPSGLVILNILAMAFHCHCNACKYYRELAKTAPNHFGKVTLVAMAFCGLLYGVMGAAGFKTFGFNASGTILQNYALTDWPINIARVLVCMSLIASYGIMFSALRESAIAFFRLIASAETLFEGVWTQDCLSTVLVILITFIGVLCHDTGLVDGFVGAFCGNAIIFIIPCALYVAAVKANLDARRNQKQLWCSYFLIALGVAFAIIGCTCLVKYEMISPEPADRGIIYGNDTAQQTNATKQQVLDWIHEVEGQIATMVHTGQVNETMDEHLAIELAEAVNAMETEARTHTFSRHFWYVR